MNQKWQGVRFAAILCGVIGWWGLWYPEFAKEVDGYAIVQEDGTVLMASEVIECEFDKQIYSELLEMDGSQIRLRSKFLMWLEEYYEKDRSEQ